MTKKERRQEWLNKHYATMERLAAYVGRPQSGKKLSTALFKLEQQAHKAAEDYCNGKIDPDKWSNITDAIIERVEALLGKLPGLIVNGDARGYALKIDSQALKYYESVGLHRDWGGNGILSPEVDV